MIRGKAGGSWSCLTTVCCSLGKLKESEFPFLGPSNLSSRNIVIYIVGGFTYEEVSASETKRMHMQVSPVPCTRVVSMSVSVCAGDGCRPNLKGERSFDHTGWKPRAQLLQFYLRADEPGCIRRPATRESQVTAQQCPCCVLKNLSATFDEKTIKNKKLFLSI